MHRVCTSTCDSTPDWDIIAQGSYLTVTTTVPFTATSTMDFSIQMPSSVSDYNQQSPNITIQATAS